MEVYWIGGVTCSGKSTLARLLAGRHGWAHYETDAHFDRHAREADAVRQPTMHAFQHDKGWNVWSRSLEGAEKAAVWLQFYRERFASIVADLKACEGPVVAEGVELLPEAVDEIGQGGRGVWLVPTRAFFERREGPVCDWDYYRDMIEQVGGQTEKLGLLLILSDGAAAVEETAAAVESRWGLGGPPTTP